jgi:hypothetical protein
MSDAGNENDNLPSTPDLIAEVLEASYRMKAGGDLILHLLVDGAPPDRLDFVGGALELMGAKLQAAAEELERRDWGRNKSAI